MLNILVCCLLEEGCREEGAAARNLGAVGWDLIEQVKTAKSSIQTNVPLIWAFLQGGEGLQAFLCGLDVGVCQLFACCLSIGDLVQVLK